MKIIKGKCMLVVQQRDQSSTSQEPSKKQREDNTYTFLAMCKLFLTPEERVAAAQEGVHVHEMAMKKVTSRGKTDETHDTEPQKSEGD